MCLNVVKTALIYSVVTLYLGLRPRIIENIHRFVISDGSSNFKRTFFNLVPPRVSNTYNSEFSTSSRDISGHGQHNNVSAGLFAIIFLWKPSWTGTLPELLAQVGRWNFSSDYGFKHWLLVHKESWSNFGEGNDQIQSAICWKFESPFEIQYSNLDGGRGLNRVTLWALTLLASKGVNNCLVPTKSSETKSNLKKKRINV